jgi:hypothetical protein
MEQKIFQHAYNLVQNFYIVGLERKNDTLISSMLSKYPKIDVPYIKISDEIIINVSRIFNTINNYSTVFQMDYL